MWYQIRYGAFFKRSRLSNCFEWRRRLSNFFSVGWTKKVISFSTKCISCWGDLNTRLQVQIRLYVPLSHRCSCMCKKKISCQCTYILSRWRAWYQIHYHVWYYIDTKSTWGFLSWDGPLGRGAAGARLGNPFPKPIENDALNSGRPHRFGLV